MFRDTHFVLQKVQTHKASSLVYKEIVWNSRRLDYSELPNILFRDVKGEYFAKGTEK